MADKGHIALLTTVANFDLYRRTATRFPQGIRRFAIDGTNGMHAFHSIRYMMKKLRGRGIEWLIMADEDVVFTDPDAVFGIIDQMEKDRITACGVRDGGVVAHRFQNPHLPNTFFCILHFAAIERKWDPDAVRRQQFTVEGEFGRDWQSVPYAYDERSVFEPYYCFFLWLRRAGHAFLFLDADMPFADDAISNAVYFKGKRILYHTWYARSYGKHLGHTGRIDAVLEAAGLQPGPFEEPVLFRDRFFAIRQKWRKWRQRIANRLVKRP